MESKTIDVIDLMYSFSEKDIRKDMLTPELLKFLHRSRKEMKIAKKELEAWCLQSIKELEEIGKTSKELGKQCDFPSIDEDSFAFAIEDETSHEALAKLFSEPKFRVFMDVSNFEREDVSVRFEINQLVVRAEHGIQMDEHGTISRKFTRKFDVPKEVDVETLRCFIDAYSVLIVEGSFKPQEVEERSREIVVLEDTCSQGGLQPFRDLKQFKALSVSHQKDFGEIINIAENLLDRRQSRDIPIETA